MFLFECDYCLNIIVLLLFILTSNVQNEKFPLYVTALVGRDFFISLRQSNYQYRHISF